MADISAIKLPNGTTYNLKDTTARNAASGAVPNSRTVNGKALSSNISLGAGDVGAYTKKETDTKISAAVASAYKYKGSVTADKLPTSGQVVGDVYNITNDSSYGKAGMNVAWNGTTWDALGSNVDLSNYVTTSDSRLSNARPASDVYAWAKAAKKPSYSASEIGAAPTSHNHDDRYEIAYRSNFASNSEYIRLGIATMRQSGDYLFIRVYSGSGFNGQITQDRAFDIHLRTSNGSGPLYAGYVEYHLNGSSNNDVYIVPNSSGTTYAIWIGLTSYSGNGFYIVEESNGAGWSNSQTTSNSIPSGAIKLTQKNIAYTSDIPTSLPANGGNATTVNGHSVNADVPSGAKFTDTTYGAATQSADGLMSKSDKAKLDGIGAGSNVKSVNGKTGAVSLSKADVGLGNVDNTSDADKHVKANNIQWGGVNIVNDISPLDVATSNLFAGNIMAYSRAAGITVEYSTDGGTTWTDYGADDKSKIRLVTPETGEAHYCLGKKDTAQIATKDLLRISLDARKMGIYCNPKNLLIYIITNGGTGCYVNIEYSTRASDTVFHNFGKYDISGWSGWNSIPIYNISTFGTNGWDDQTVILRLTFGFTGYFKGWETKTAFKVLTMSMIASNRWDTPSTMARVNSIYSIDENQNATFPAKVTATSFSGATATSSADGLMSKSDKSKLDGIGAGSNVKSVNSKTGAVTLTKSDIGLSNVDNTADSAKSVKYAASAGSANSVAWTNVSGRPNITEATEAQIDTMLKSLS